ncbi:MAG: M28 family peptidase [Firmicutes bacterium]|nr:M28 family peptidase [Bacillota bacterium]
MTKSNKRLTILLLVLFMIGAIALPAFALPKQAFDNKVVKRISIDHAWGHLEYLAEEIGPRATGSTQEKAAAQYLANVFESYGYQTTLQEFNLPTNVIVPEVKVIAPVEYQLFPAPITQTALTLGGGVTGQIVDWGNSLTPPNDASGKIALMDSATNATRSTNYTTYRTAAMDAGATGIIIVQKSLNPTSLGGRVHTPTSAIPIIIVSNEQGDAIRNSLVTGETIVNIKLETQKTSYNVVATRKPQNAKKQTGKALIIGGHYDSVYGAPGANDNASSIAAMLEVARVIADYPIGMEVRFIAFGGEERGFLGSYAYVNSLSPSERAQVVGMINMEMLGSAYEPVEFMFAATSNGINNLMIDSVIDAGSRISKTVQWGGRVGSSDHVPFQNAGIPAIVYARAYPGSMPWGGGNGLEAWYHTPFDTIDRMSKERLEEATLILGAATYEILRPDTPNLKRSAIRREIDFPEVHYLVDEIQ